MSYDCFMSETGADLSRTLEEVVRRIVGVAHPDRIILFGSAARGEMGLDSDIDLLVIKRGVPHRGRLAGQIHRALVGVSVAVDVMVATPEDVEYLRDRVGSIMGPALREGREIYALAETLREGWMTAPLLVAEGPPPRLPITTWDALARELDADRLSRAA
jgi:uncharacterized protein